MLLVRRRLNKSSDRTVHMLQTISSDGESDSNSTGKQASYIYLFQEEH